MENKLNTDEQLRNTLREFEAIPDSGSFDAILEKMNKKKKRRFFFVFFWTGLIALSGLMISLLIHFYGNENSISSNASQTPTLSSIHPDSSTRTFPSSITSQHPDATSTSRSSSLHHTTSNSEIIIPEVKKSTASLDKTKQNETLAGNTQTLKKAQDLKQTGQHRTASNAKSTAYNHNVTASERAPFEKINKAQASDLNKEQETGLFQNSSQTLTTSELMYITARQIPFTNDPIEPEITVSIKELPAPVSSLNSGGKNTFSFYLGAQASPQLNGFGFSDNPNRNASYTSPGIDFPGFYLNTKKDQSHLNFNIPFGIKAGFRINNSYEVFAGFGIQSFIEKEKLYIIHSDTIVPTLPGGVAYNSGSAPDNNRNHFRYVYYSLEANRLFHSTRTIGFKLGAGLSGNQLLSSSYVYVMDPNVYRLAFQSREKLNPWILTAKVRAGVIFRANKSFQLHISPGFFYSPTSIFKKEYVIRQKPFGFDIECMILFRLFRISGK